MWDMAACVRGQTDDWVYKTMDFYVMSEEVIKEIILEMFCLSTLKEV